MTENEFLQWESDSKDTIDFKKIYIDISGDILAGLMLSQIIYWNLPSKKNGESKLRVFKHGRLWLCKSDRDWWDEIRLTEKQSRTARQKLVKKSIIDVVIFRFNGNPKSHIAINFDVFLQTISDFRINPLKNPRKVKDEKDSLAHLGELNDLPNEANCKLPNGRIKNALQGEFLTESTSKTTTKNTIASKAVSIHPLVMNLFSTKYQELTGNTLSINGKEGALVKGIIKMAGGDLELIKKKMLVLEQRVKDDKFIMKLGFTPMALSSQWNALIVPREVKSIEVEIEQGGEVY